MSKQLKQVVQTLFFFFIGLALVYFQIKSLGDAERQAVLTSIKQADVVWVGIAMLISVLSHFLRAIRWKMLINSSHESVKLNHAFFAVMIGYLINGFVPRLGEIMRCGILGKKEHIKVEKLIGTVVIERLVDLCLMCFVVAITLVLQYDILYTFLNEKLFTPFLNRFASSLPQIFKTILILLIATIVIVYVIKFLAAKFGIKDKIESVKDSFLEGIRSLKNLSNKPLFFAYSILMWICYFFMSYTVFLSLDDAKHLGVNAGLSVLTTGSLALIIPTPGGLGAYHQFVSNTLSLYDISNVTGVSLSWLIWSANFFMILIVGLLSLMFISRKSNTD